MKFENDFDVEAPIEEVYKAILDVERVAPCVPGAQVVEHTSEDVYKVAIKVKVGPMSMQYHGDVKIVESDPEQHRVVMRTRAKEARGQGTADANVEMRLEGDDSRTHGTISTDVKLSGRAAAMGGGVIQDVSARIVDTFAQNLAAMLAGGKSAAVETPAAPAGGESATSAPAPSADEPPEAGDEGEPKPSAGPTQPTPPRGAPAPDQEASLPVLSIVAGRLRDPRAMGAALGVVAVVAFALGRRGR